MKIGVFAVLFQNLPLAQALDKIKGFGVNTVEIGCGNYPGNAHCNPPELLVDDQKTQAFVDAFKSRAMTISALSVHGNMIHPNKEFAKANHDAWRSAVLLAEKLGIDTVVNFSGCPGDSERSANPNWVTCSWPPDYMQILDWQWNEVLIPYWKREAAFAREHGVTKIALEMHPGFCVYNPETLLRLRAAVGPEIGANFDPSHLVWQGIDPCLAIKELGKAGALFHFHAKDTYIDQHNTARNGVLDTKSYTFMSERSWIFRSVGYGIGEQKWRDIVSALRLAGYDGALSIEHEDALASTDEGLKKAVECLKEVVFEEPMLTEAYWV
ncbi:MAG: sugar phosphate isomerase/epimerase [Negativicutes bacterium]|jgi:sugar phosphate isomerase/epimerase